MARRVENVTNANSGYCKTEDIKFINLDSDDNPDMEWRTDNPTCIAYFGSVGAAFKGTKLYASSACLDVKAAEEELRSFLAGVPVSPKMARNIAKDVAKCGSSTAACISSLGADAFNCGLAINCCAATTATAISFGIAMAELRLIYTAAVDSQKNAHICGAGWNVWEAKIMTPGESDDLANIPNYVQGSLTNDELYVYGIKDGSYQKYLTDRYNNGSMQRRITNQEYREFIYGGKEFADKGENACKNPWNAARRLEILGFSDDNQRYYMRGASVASNYACSRFLLYRGTADEIKSAKEAYECCKERSQNTLCIEERDAVTNSTNYEFCEEGQKCKVQYVWYSIAQAKQVPNFICAETYSVCPFNHRLGGGTEIKDYYLRDSDFETVKDNNGNPIENRYKVVTNHCQYLKHCAKKPDVPFIRTSDLNGAWISSACYDLKGDSQNNYGYTADLIPINTKNFSAPIAQCFKETLENMFVNRAGKSKCSNSDEEPNADGICSSGYFYKKGEVMPGPSFFQTIQNNLRGAIRMAMTIAVTIAGFAVLLSGKPWDKKTIMMFVVKLSLVAYFALGTAWQDYFFEGVSSVSTGIADIFMKFENNVVPEKLDGCQFPKYNYAWQEGMVGSRYDIAAYPPEKEYLKIWDTLDCKIARALGFGPEVSVPNLIIIIVAGLISNGLGLIFFIATFIFAFYMIALTVRALHIFLISSMAITILIYVSPITITASLFKKTEGIFKSWRTNLLSFVMQPLILFTYLGMVIIFFDHIMIGDARFTGNGQDAPKQIDCSADDPNTAGTAGDNSIYCIFKFNNIRNNNSLSPLGIIVPELFNMNQQKVNTIIKAAFLMFVFAKFIDKIIDLAVKLAGGSFLKSNSMNVGDGLIKAYGTSSAIQSRGSRGAKKWGEKLASAATNRVSMVGKASLSTDKASSYSKEDKSFIKSKAKDQKNIKRGYSPSTAKIPTSTSGTTGGEGDGGGNESA